MEGAKGQESMERAALVEALRTRGIEDLETRELLIAWAQKKEESVEREGTREAQVNFEIERAELYRDAGFLDEAVQAFSDAYTIAVNEGLDNMATEIEEKISSLQ